MSAIFASSLMQWFQQNAADLPWRRSADPYRIWVSEIMLQQTRIETVIAYYNRFLEQYPTVRHLANAPLDEALKLWEGLGYYSRVRNLHKSARIIAHTKNGRFPQTAAELQTLPGIGGYTAAAIASIAFQEPVPALDGNVIRVFARLLDLREDVSRPKTKTALRGLAKEWMPIARPGDYNQALMELGQRICLPRKPQCPVCPIKAHCKAFANGTQNERPLRAKKSPLPHYDVAAAIIRNRDGKCLIAQRPYDGLLGGLWEFPGGKVEDGESLQQCLRRELREELAIAVDVGALFLKVRQAFTHFKITLYAYECCYRGAISPYTEPQKLGAQDWAWTSLDELANYSFGKADRQIIAALRQISAP